MEVEDKEHDASAKKKKAASVYFTLTQDLRQFVSTLSDSRQFIFFTTLDIGKSYTLNINVTFQHREKLPAPTVFVKISEGRENIYFNHECLLGLDVSFNDNQETPKKLWEFLSEVSEMKRTSLTDLWKSISEDYSKSLKREADQRREAKKKRKKKKEKQVILYCRILSCRILSCRILLQFFFTHRHTRYIT
jgi:ribosomal protein S25